MVFVLSSFRPYPPPQLVAAMPMDLNVSIHARLMDVTICSSVYQIPMDVHVLQAGKDCLVIQVSL